MIHFDPSLRCVLTLPDRHPPGPFRIHFGPKPQDAGHGVIQSQAVLLNQFQDRHRCHRLGKTGNAKQALRLDDLATLSISNSKTPGIDQATVPHDRNRGPRQPMTPQEPDHHPVQ